jgi:hypothetical protein
MVSSEIALNLKGRKQNKIMKMHNDTIKEEVIGKCQNILSGHFLVK